MTGNYCFPGNKIQSKLHKQTVCDISTRRGFFPLTQFKWHFPKEARKGRHGVFYSPRYFFFDPDYILVSSDSELVQKYYISHGFIYVKCRYILDASTHSFLDTIPVPFPDRSGPSRKPSFISNTGTPVYSQELLRCCWADSGGLDDRCIQQPEPWPYATFVMKCDVCIGFAETLGRERGVAEMANSHGIVSGGRGPCGAWAEELSPSGHPLDTDEITISCSLKTSVDSV